MNKWFAWLLLALLSLGTAQAEGLTLWSAHNLDHLQSELDLFERVTGTRVVQQHFGADHIRDKIISSVLLPDLYFLPSDQLSNYREYRLEPWPASLGSVPMLFQDGWLDGKLYGLPLNMGNQLVLYYNKEKATRVNHLADIPDGQLTWPNAQAYWFIPFLTAKGGWPLSEKGFALDTPQMIAALKVYKAQIKRFPSSQCDLQCSLQAFIRGDVSYLISGDWDYQDLLASMGKKLGVALLPRLEGHPMVPMSSSYVLAVRSGLSPEKQHAAYALARFLLSDDSQHTIYLRSHLFPASKKVFRTLEPKLDPNMKVLYEQLTHSRAMPNDRRMLIAWLVMGKVLPRFLVGDYDAAEAAATMQSLAEDEEKQG